MTEELPVRRVEAGFVGTPPIRAVLVTALALDIGRWIWPGGLYRRPDLDPDELEDDRAAALVP